LVSGPQLENFAQKYRLFGSHNNKNLKKYTQNIEKSLILDSSLGRRIFFWGRGLATPVLGDCCLNFFKYLVNLLHFQLTLQLQQNCVKRICSITDFNELLQAQFDFKSNHSKLHVSL
jgi:hypothetical protein